MLQDIDLKYRGGAIATTKPVVIDGALTVGGALAVTGGATIGGRVLADPSNWQPEDHGFTAWNNDPSIVSSSSLPTLGTIYLQGIRIRRAATITNVFWGHSVAGVTPTSGQSWAGLVAANGTLLSSVGIDAKVTGAGLQSATLAAPQSVTAGLYWVCLLFNAATAPTLLRTGGLSASFNNANLGSSTKRFAINGTSQTALPGSFTPASNTDGSSFWVAVN